jgi:phage terminase large subunit
MPLPFKFDFRNPDYVKVFEYRVDKLQKIRSDPSCLVDLKEYYKHNIAQFITDWGMTYDPKNVSSGLPALCPFILFDRQEEWVNWFIECWKSKRPGLTEKSRQVGMSCLTISTAVSICLFWEGITAGFGSRKEEYVDRIGDPKCLFYKARSFLSFLPPEFRGGFDIKKHAPHMRIMIPEMGSILTGEAGDNIGRGGTTSFYIVDEAAFIARPELVEASLSQNTDSRHDISTPFGMDNPFAYKRHENKIDVFSFKWQEDPRKDINWYNKMCDVINDPVIIAQELDLDYTSSKDGILIPAKWIQASIDAHMVLGIKPSGTRRAGVDIADEGKDLNAIAFRHGILLEHVESWSGKDSDIFKTTQKVFSKCDEREYQEVEYDSDGLGAGVRGDANKINEDRQNKLVFNPFRGSGAVDDPEGDPFSSSMNERGIKVKKFRTNADFFANAKAQAWWQLRRRFEVTYRAVIEKLDFNPDDIISISSGFDERRKLISELSQPTYSQNNVGKIIIDKAPDSARSPNLADAVMIAFNTKRKRRSFYDI